MRTPRSPYPAPITESLARFGTGLREYRLRRGISMASIAEQAALSRTTLHKVERGDPGVGMGVYAAVLDCYGLLSRLEDIVDRHRDRPGLAFEAARLPRRVRS